MDGLVTIVENGKTREEVVVCFCSAGFFHVSLCKSS